MKRKKMVLLLGGGLVAATALLSLFLSRPADRHFQRAAFAVVRGRPMRYDLGRYQWRFEKEKIDVGQAISRGQGVFSRRRAELRLIPGRKGKTIILFPFACKSFQPEGMHVAIVHLTRGREKVLRLFKVATKKNGYFSSILPCERGDAILLRASGGGAVIAGDAVIAGVAPPEQRRYVFVIAPDDFRGDRLGRVRGRVLLTPNLEAFSRNAVVFENAIAPSSWTLASFASFFSGLYEHHHQVTRDQAFSPGQPNLLANLAPDHAIIQLNDGAWLSPRYGFARDSDLFLTSSKSGVVYADRILFANAREILEANPLPALFMFLHTYKLHMPYEPGEEFLAALTASPEARRLGSFINKAQFSAGVPESMRRSMEELYDAEVLQFDHFFGEFIGYLKRAGIYDRSLIVLISDHGEEFGEHGGWFHGHSLYREISRVPFLVKFPRGLYAGRHFQQPVSACDALPTVLDYLKREVPPGIDGISLLPLLRGSRLPDRTIFSSTAVSLFNGLLPPRFAMFFDHYQLIYNFPLTPRARQFYQESGPPPERAEIELYDLLADPQERHDISALNKKLLDSRRPEIVRFLKEMRRFRRAGSDAGAMSEEEQNALRSLGYL